MLGYTSDRLIRYGLPVKWHVVKKNRFRVIDIDAFWKWAEDNKSMSWLDNVVAWISPEAGAKRAAWRATYNELRNYDAGNNSRLNAGWRAANYSAEMTDRTSRDTIRARARDLERNHRPNDKPRSLRRVWQTASA